MKLNIGCGKRVLKGWTNCDIVHNPKAPRAPEIICDARSIPLPDACADVLMAIHVVEHFYRWEVEKVLKEWRRLLKPGGQIILELPNLVKCCQNYLSGQKRGKYPDQMDRWGIYGDPTLEDPYMCHPWGYSPQELIALLHQCGFRGGVERPTEFHPSGRKQRDMRIEAIRA